jgi:hypothetical protein
VFGHIGHTGLTGHIGQFGIASILHPWGQGCADRASLRPFRVWLPTATDRPRMQRSFVLLFGWIARGVHRSCAPRRSCSLPARDPPGLHNLTGSEHDPPGLQKISQVPERDPPGLHISRRPPSATCRARARPAGPVNSRPPSATCRACIYLARGGASILCPPGDPFSFLATIGHDRPRSATIGHDRPRVATIGHVWPDRPSSATTGHDRPLVQCSCSSA